MVATADDEQRALAIQMAAYYKNARVGVDKTHCDAAAAETPAVAAPTKHVIMDTPSMHNVAAVAAAAAKPLADVSDATCCYVDASDEPSEARSLLTEQSTTDANRRRQQYHIDLETV